MGRILILGVGNPLMGDDGIGLAALQRLRTDWVLPEQVELVDGGTWGMQLLPALEAAEEVILIDAIETGRPAGTVVALPRDELPRLFKLRVSPHHVDLEDVLALLEFRGSAPPSIWAIGINPGPVTWGHELSEPVLEAVPALIEHLVTALRSRGLTVHRRDPEVDPAGPDRDEDAVAPGPLDYLF